MTEDIQLGVLKESQERAERLRRIRNLMNLSRKELCESADININTYIGYEVGRYGGLTKKGAKKIIDYASTKGVFSSLEWLLYGTGNTPSVVMDITHTVLNDSCMDFSGERLEELNIEKELSLFRSHYNNSLSLRVLDDGMLPTYCIGDIVAGICHVGDSLNLLIGFDCIVKLDNGVVFIRNLRRGKKENCYTLICTNPETTVEYPIMYDAKIQDAAKIIWHRKHHTNEKET